MENIYEQFSIGDNLLDAKLSGRIYPLEGKHYEKSFLGGNLKGIIKRFSYLKNLCIDCIWLYSIFETSAYHG